MAVAARLNEVTVVKEEDVDRCSVMPVALVALFTQVRLTWVALDAVAVSELGAVGTVVPVPPVPAGVVTLAELELPELPTEFEA